MINSNLIFKVFFVIIFLTGINIGYSQIWSKINGVNNYVNRIFLPYNDTNKIVVASDGTGADILQQTISFPLVGNGFQISYNGGVTFDSVKMQGISIFDFVQTRSNPNLWFSAIHKFSSGGISYSNDNGETWQTGPPFACSGSFQILKLISIPGSPESFYCATVNNGKKGLIYSNDAFDSCNPNDTLEIQARYVSVSPLDSNMIFVAGDGYYYGGVLRSLDGGLTWQKSEFGLENLRVLCVLADENDKSIVFCGADSMLSNKTIVGKGIYRSLDTGKTWQFVSFGPLNAEIFEIKQQPKNSKHLVAAAGDKGVYISSNFGWSWLPFNDGLPDSVSVRSIAVPDWSVTSEGFIIFAGTYGNGLYKSIRIYNSIEDENKIVPNGLQILNIYPQPCSDFLNISFYNPKPGNINYKIFDLFGRILLSSENNFYGEGAQTINWNPDKSLNSGSYILTINSGINYISKKINLIK